MNLKPYLLANRIITALFYAAFPILIFALGLKEPMTAVRPLLVCGIGFVLCTLVRKLINAPRPYEKDLKIKAPSPKAEKGLSFPSRHVFSAAIIGAAWFYYYPLCGIFALAATVVLAYLRVVTHYHFKKDVIAGGIAGFLLGIVGFWLIP